MEKQKTEELPLVSIFAICHNHAKYVIETLDSIKNQSYPFIQLIIIDNCSNDGSEILIEKWIQETQYPCEFIRNPQSYIVPINCNTALKHVEGKYFQGISCDDIIMMEKVENQVTLFESLNETYACIYADAIRIDATGNIMKEGSFFHDRKKKFNYEKMPSGDLKFELQRMTFISAPTILLRTSAIKSIGGYLEDLYVEDWPMYIRISLAGHLFHPLNEIVAEYRIHDKSMDQQRNSSYYLSLVRTYEMFHLFFDMKDPFITGKWFECLMQYRRRKIISAFKHLYFYCIYTRKVTLKKFIKFLINRQNN